MDWFVWRLLTSDRIRVTMAELRDVWTFDDMVTAHEILDAFDDAAARAREASS